jgi:hypothetical protein
MLEKPVYMRLLLNLESRKLMGEPITRAARDEELKWFEDLKLRMRNIREEFTDYDKYLILRYMEFLQFNDSLSRTKVFSPDFEERIAQLIKYHLLEYKELRAYIDYCEPRWDEQ